MPQFPIQPPKQNEQPDDSASPQSNGQTKAGKDKAPLKFKSAQPAGPVTRVRLKDVPKSKHPKKSPFKDEGLFEDKDSLAKFRDDVGRPLVLTLGAIALVACIYWFSTSKDDPNAINEKLEALLAQADQVEEDSLINSEQYQTRIELADQLIGFTKETSAVDRGATLKLKTLTQLMTDNLKRSTPDSDNQELLESTSRQFINSRNKLVANYAKLGLTLIRANKYLELPQPSYFGEILARFRSVANSSKEDSVAAQNLLDVADLYANRGLKDESEDFYQAINFACSTSHDQTIAAIGQKAKSKIASGDSLADELKQLLEGVKNSKDFPLEAVRAKIAENTSKEKINATRMTAILDFVDFLMQQNAIPQVNLILEDISNSILGMDAGVQRDTVKRRLDNFNTLVSQFGQTFKFDGLFSVEGRPITQASLKQHAKFVVFWSPDNSKSVEVVNQLSRNYKEFKQRNIQLIAVADISQDAEDKNKILEMSNNTKGMEFLTIVKGNSQSQALYSRYPIPSVPYWILLDPDDKIRGFKTLPRFIRLDSE